MSNIIDIGNTLEKTITRNGFTVTIMVYKSDQPKLWILEIQDEFGGSVLWDDPFSSPQLAMKEALRSIDDDGIEAFITNLDDISDLDDIPTLNRVAITITGTQSFVDWINSLDTSAVTLADVNEEALTFMVDMEDDMGGDNMDEFVMGYYETIFEEELAGWYLDDSAWPQNRDWALFQQFFNYSISSVVFDLGRVPIMQEVY